MLLKEFIVNFFLPKQSLAYYSVYLRFWRSINLKKKLLHICLLRCLLLIIAYQIVKYLLIEWLAPSPITRIVLVDVINLMYPQLPGINFMAVLMLFMIMSLVYLNYFKCDPKVNDATYRMLFYNEWDTFLWSIYRRIHVCEYLRQYAVKCLLISPIFTVAVYLFFIYAYLYLWYLIYINSDFFFASEAGFACLVFFHINAFLAVSAFVGLKHIFLLSCLVGITMTTIAVVRMAQIRLYLGRFFKFDSFHISEIHRIIILNLYFINKGSWLYGTCFLIFFIINTPVNLLLTVYLIFSQLTLLQRVILLMLLFGQLIGLFGCHFMMTLYSKMIHQPSKGLMHYYVANQATKLSLKCRLKLVHLISMLHVRKQYGVSYGPFGLVTVTTFFKFIILYFKFLLIVYKMHTKLNKT